MQPQFIPSPHENKNITDRRFRHSLSRDPLYAVWKNIVQRCTNPSCSAYADYGGRGISICDEWRRDFLCFYHHVIQLPNFNNKDYSLDRISNNGNYEPGNMRWATRSEQNRNSRHNLLLTFNGKTQCVSQWAEETGIKAATIWARVVSYGWNIEKALTTPAQKWGR